MTGHVGVGGAWKDLAAVSVGVGGAWKTVSDGWVGVGGAWKKFYAALVIALPSTIGETKVVADPADATAGITFSSNGTYAAADGTPSGNWATPTTTGVGSDYEIRWTNVSGTLTTGTAGSWLDMASGQYFDVQRTTVGTKSCQGTVEIRDKATSTVQTTSTVTLTAEVSL